MTTKLFTSFFCQHFFSILIKLKTSFTIWLWHKCQLNDKKNVNNLNKKKVITYFVKF